MFLYYLLLECGMNKTIMKMFKDFSGCRLCEPLHLRVQPNQMHILVLRL